MNTKIESAERFEPVSLSSLPDGEYTGSWSGYTVEATINGASMRFQASNGVRGMNCPCKVHVANGEVTVTG